MPIADAATSSANGSGRAADAQRDGLDQQRLDEVEREVRRRLARAPGRRAAPAAPRMARKNSDRAERRAAAEPDARGDQRDARGEHDQHRLEDHPELRHAEVELGLEGRQPEQEARPASDDAAHAARPTAARRARRGLALARRASTSSTASPTSVIAAPPISIRCVGPHSVTSWPNRRCQTSSSGKPISEKAPQAAISTPPSGAYQSSAMLHRAPGRLLQRQAHREEAGEKMPNSPARMK